MKKRGIILPAILILISLLVLMALTRHFFSRQQLHFADILADKEQAYYAANGLRRIAITLLEKSFKHYNSAAPETRPKLATADNNSKAILEKLINADGEPSGQPVSCRLTTPALREYIEAMRQNGIAVDDYSVEFTFTPVSKLYQAAASGNGLQPDANEISFKLLLRCFARVKDSGKTVLWYREGRTISLQPPVVGKFSLLLTDPDSDSINQLRIDNKSGSNNPLPTFVYNGISADRASKSAQEARDLIDAQGWVYFGNSTNIDIRLNEHCSMLNPLFYTTGLDSGDFLATKGTFSYYYHCDYYKHSLKSSPDGLAAFAEADARDFYQTTTIATNGSAGNPSPTLLLGRVTRSFPIVQGLNGSKSGRRFPFPFISKDVFSTDFWPCRLNPAEIELIRQNFAHDYEKYRQRMSFIYQEPFNAANFQLIDLGKAHREFAVLQPEALPASVIAPPALKRLKINGNTVDFCNFAAGTAYSLIDDEGRVIFANASLNAIADFSFINNKVTKTFAGQQAFFASCAKTKNAAIDLAGAIAIKSDLDISKPLAISESGGMLICQGNIRIAAPVSSKSQAPLTIISLSGNITISSDIKVNAALIALNGSIIAGSRTTINGLAACRQFKADVTDSAAATIIYNQAFDCTSSTARKSSYRLCLDEKEYYLVE